MKYDVCIIGGFGHVGLPRAIAFASKGHYIYILEETMPSQQAY